MALDIVRLCAMVAATFTALIGWFFIASRAFAATAGIGSRRGASRTRHVHACPLVGSATDVFPVDWRRH